MTERFYSGERDTGALTVREGGFGETKPVHCRFDYRKYITERAGGNSDHARLALTLLGDVLEDERWAAEAHEYFMKRVIPILPKKFTISRSRVLAYVNVMASDKSVEAYLARPGNTLSEK
jgi:hypothetical protein